MGYVSVAVRCVQEWCLAQPGSDQLRANAKKTVRQRVNCARNVQETYTWQATMLRGVVVPFMQQLCDVVVNTAAHLSKAVDALTNACL